jgi:hypothetical protein
MVNITSRASSTYRIYLLKKIKISIIGGISKFLKLLVCGQCSANLTVSDYLGQIWANFVALIVAKSMPKAKLKS